MKYTVVGTHKLTRDDDQKIILLSRALGDKGYYLIAPNHKPTLPLRRFYNSTVPYMRLRRSYRSFNQVKEMLLTVMDGQINPIQASHLVEFFAMIYSDGAGAIVNFVLCYTKDGKKTPKTKLQEMICKELDIPFLWIGNPNIYNKLLNI